MQQRRGTDRNFEVPARTCADTAYLYSGVRGASQKGHNGVCSQIGVHNEATRKREGEGEVGCKAREKERERRVGWRAEVVEI